MVNPAVGEDSLGPMERGRKKYFHKDYAGALAAFTEAVDMSTGHLLVTALDHRAAAHEKLRQLQPALRDAKRMIDLKPEISKGYLRCGKILQMKGEKGLAAKIYERGLNKVKIGSDDERTRLQSIYNKLRRSQDPGKSLDPLEFLPLELAAMVCNNLSMRDRVTCLAVSKSWKLLLEKSHNLWTTLDTTSVRKPMTQTALRAHLRRSNYTLDRAVITVRAGFDAQKFVFLTKHCKKLRILDIHGGSVIGNSLTLSLPYARNLESISVLNEITTSVVLNALRACGGTLVKAEFLQIVGKRTDPLEKWPSLDALKVLRLEACDSFPLDIVNLIEATPNMQVLSLFNWRPTSSVDMTPWTKLRILTLGGTYFDRLPKLPRTLRDLALLKAPKLNRNMLEIQGENPLPMLEMFDCTGTNVCDGFIKAITLESTKRGNLRELRIGYRAVNPHISVEDEYPSSESLENLSLAYLNLPEDCVMQIVSRCPNLRTLDVSATKVTGVAVKSFVKQGITSLTLDECIDVGSDAVDWARGEGVEVKFNVFSSGAGLRAFRNAPSYAT